MKRWQRILLMLVIVAAVCILACSCTEPTTEPSTEPTTEPTIEPIPMEGLECLVKVWTPAGSGGGSDIDPYEYYAIRESGVEQVSAETVMLVAPEMIDSVGFVNEGTTRWFVQLIYMPQVELFDGHRFADRNNPWLPTDFGENIRIYYDVWSGLEVEAGPEIEKVMLQAAYAFHDGDPENYTSRGGGPGDDFSRGLTSFMFISNGEKLFVEDREDNLYRPMPDGTFQLLLELSDDESRIDYYWFPPQ